VSLLPPMPPRKPTEQAVEVSQKLTDARVARERRAALEAEEDVEEKSGRRRPPSALRAAATHCRLGGRARSVGRWGTPETSSRTIFEQMAREGIDPRISCTCRASSRRSPAS